MIGKNKKNITTLFISEKQFDFFEYFVNDKGILINKNINAE